MSSFGRKGLKSKKVQENKLMISSPNKIWKHTEWIVLLRWHKNIAYKTLHMEAGVLTIADIQPRFWTQQRTSRCFQLGHHFFCQFPNAMKTFNQVYGNFSPLQPPPRIFFKFRFHWIQRNKFDQNMPILVYAFVFPKNYTVCI